MGATVVDQIELHIPATAIGLKLALARAVGMASSTLHDGQIGLNEGVTHRLGHGKTLGKTQFRKIVIEHAANTPGLVTVLEIKVFIAPLFKPRIQPGPKRLQGLGAGLVKVHRVFVERIVGGQVHAAAKPPDVFFASPYGLGNKHPHIHMHRGHIRIVRVKHQGHANRLKSSACKHWPVLGGRGRKVVSAHMGKTHATAFE